MDFKLDQSCLPKGLKDEQGMNWITTGLLLATLVASNAQIQGGVHAYKADDAWFGTWTLNRARSKFTSSTLTIARADNGYSFDFGAIAYVVSDDGSDSPTIDGRTTSLKPLGPNKWFRVHKQMGRVLDESTITLTANSKTMLIDTTAYDEQGHTRESHDTEQRVGDGSGLVGVWRNSNVGVGIIEVIVIEDAGQMRWKITYPNEGQFFTAAPDREPAALLGVHGVAGITVKLHRISPMEMRWTEYIGAKPYSEGIDLLEDLGKTMREVTWLEQHPSEKQIAVYERSRT